MARLEAALLVANGALSTRKLTSTAMLADTKEALTLIDQLNFAYDQSRSAFRIERVAAGYQMLDAAQVRPLARSSARTSNTPQALIPGDGDPRDRRLPPTDHAG